MNEALLAGPGQEHGMLNTSKVMSKKISAETVVVARLFPL